MAALAFEWPESCSTERSQPDKRLLLELDKQPRSDTLEQAAMSAAGPVTSEPEGELRAKRTVLGKEYVGGGRRNL